MIITRTPYRVSFFGGGTDYHTWYQEHGGSVLSTTINHYCYLSARYLPPFFENKSRIVWSKIEEVAEHSDIKHPAVRGILDYLKVERGVEIHHQGDLPARSGLGSSSTFTVGLLNAIYGLRGMMSSKRQLACEAVHIEREVLKESVGVQDQIAAAYGGFNKINILPTGNFSVEPIILPQGRMEDLQSHMMLFFTGVSRTASSVAEEQIKVIRDKQSELESMQVMVDEALDVLCKGRDIEEFGRLMHESWQIKRSLTSSISPAFVDDIYAKAQKAGAIGGKLLGAGGGGFILFFAKPEYQPAILEALRDLLYVPMEFENSGSTVIYCEQNNYSQTSMIRRDFMHLQPQAEEVITDEQMLALNENRKTKLTII